MAGDCKIKQIYDVTRHCRRSTQQFLKKGDSMGRTVMRAGKYLEANPYATRWTSIYSQPVGPVVGVAGDVL